MEDTIVIGPRPSPKFPANQAELFSQAGWTLAVHPAFYRLRDLPEIVQAGEQLSLCMFYTERDPYGSFAYKIGKHAPPDGAAIGQLTLLEARQKDEALVWHEVSNDGRMRCHRRSHALPSGSLVNLDQTLQLSSKVY